MIIIIITCRQDGKRPDGLTVMPFEGGRALTWDVTVICSMADSYIQIEGGEGEVENLTPHISPVGGHGAPKFFLAVGPQVAYLSSEHGVSPVTGRGGGIFQRNGSAGFRLSCRVGSIS